MGLTIKWDHVHLRSADPDGAAEYYEKHFGAVRRARTENGDQLRVTIEISGLLLFIDRAARDAVAASEPPPIGFNHLAFTVDDLGEALAYLDRGAVKIISGPTQIRPGLKIAFVSAPDGVRIELLERREVA